MRLSAIDIRVVAFALLSLVWTSACAEERAEWLAAAISGDVAELGKLLSMNPRLLNARDEYGRDALQISAYAGNTASVALLLDKGAPIEEKADYRRAVPVPPLDGRHFFMASGETPLGLAIAARHPETAHLLLDRGANPLVEDNSGRTLLFNVCDATLARRLMSAGLDPNKVPAKPIYANFPPPSPLVQVVQCRDSAVVRELLSRGANPNHRIVEGETPLHVALQYKAPLDAVRALLDAGADLEARTVNGATPLIFAAESSDDPAIIELLLARGAKVDARDKRGLAAVDKTYGPRAEDKRRLLVAAGAVPSRNQVDH